MRDYEVIKTGFDCWDVRRGGLTIAECPTKKDANRIAEGLRTGKINEIDLITEVIP